MNKILAIDELSQAHSQRLLLHIASLINQQGPITFAEYMRLALYAPGLGYYSAGARKFGEAGDFVTAPEISRLFSQCVARQCAQVLTDLLDGVILEFGAGTGVMAVHILRSLQKLNRLPKNYYILEVSADLRERQQQLFKQQAPDLMSLIIWLDRLPDHAINGVILANEVLDAMPVHKFIWQERLLREYYVDFKEKQLCWRIDKPSCDRLVQKNRALNITFAENYESEINLQLAPWISSVGALLNSGLFLITDYGYPRYDYYHPDRACGTIMCHYRHHAHSNPLIYPGIQDITAHVDFTAVAEAASECDFAVSGYTHQTGFLLNCGITDLLHDITDQFELIKATQQVKQLTLPSEMGELFKAIALTKNYDQLLLGFSNWDLRAKL